MLVYRSPILYRFCCAICLLISLVLLSCGEKPLVEDGKKPFVEDIVKDEDSKLLDGHQANDWSITKITSAKGIQVRNDIFFVDDTHGWIVGAFGTLYRSEDAGLSWSEIKVNIPHETYISRIFFINPKQGWLLAAKYNVEIAANQFWVMRTEDGGTTWSILHTEKGAVVGVLKFADEKVGYIAGYTYPNTDERPIKADVLLLRSDDAGSTWLNLSKEFNDLKATEDREIGTTYMNDRVVEMQFEDPTRIKVITHSRRVLATNDGGRSWAKTSQYNHDDPQVGIVDFGYKDDGAEWLLESTYSIEGIRTRLKTRDESNRLKRRLIDGVYLNSAFYLSGDSFVAAGRTGNLLRDADQAVIWITNDDGQTWHEVFRDPNMHGVNRMIRTSSNTFVALCDDGTILRLTHASN